LNELKCPACGNADVRRVALLFMDGTSGIQLSSSALGLRSVGELGGLGGAATFSQGTQQTALAQALTPPQKSQLGTMCLGGAIVVGLLLAVYGSDLAWYANVVGIAVVLGGLYLYRRLEATSRDEYARSMAAWERSFLCMRCGKRFEAEV